MIRNGEKKGEEQLEENASKLIFFPSACPPTSATFAPLPDSALLLQARERRSASPETAPFVGLIPAGTWSAAKLQSLLLTLTLMVAAFGVSPVAARKYVTDPFTGKVVTTPEYSGTITYVRSLEPANIDLPYAFILRIHTHND